MNVMALGPTVSPYVATKNFSFEAAHTNHNYNPVNNSSALGASIPISPIWKIHFALGAIKAVPSSWRYMFHCPLGEGDVPRY